MYEQHVTFKTAKLAKQIGFDWQADKIFYQQGEQSQVGQVSRSPDNSDYYNVRRLSYKYPERVVEIPTQGLLSKWLRDVHKMHVSAYPIFTNRYYYSVRKFYDDKPYEQIIGGVNNPEDAKESFEEALEEALYETLMFLNTSKKN